VLSCCKRRLKKVSVRYECRRKGREEDEPAFPTRGSKINPTKALGTWNCSQVSSMEATRKSVDEGTKGHKFLEENRVKRK